MRATRDQEKKTFGTNDRELQSDEMLRSNLLSHISDSVIVTNLQGRIIYWNNGATKIFGYKASEMLGKTPAILYPNLNVQKFSRDLGQILKGKEIFGQWQGRRKDGKLVWLDVKTTVLKDRKKKPIGIVGIATDITERKLLSEELAGRVKQQQAVARLGQIALSGAPIDEIFLFAMDNLTKILGVEFAEILELLPGQKQLLFRAGIGWGKSHINKTTISAGKKSQAGYTLLAKEPLIVKDLRAEKRFHSVLLSKHKVQSGMSVVIFNGLDLWGVLGVHAKSLREFTLDDIHFLQSMANILSQVIERRSVEAEQYRLSEIVASSDDAIVSKTLDGIITSWNSAAERIFEYTEKEAVGKPITIIIPTQLRNEEKEIIRKLRQGERINHFETVRITKSGREVFVSLGISPVKNRRGEVIGAAKIARDITAKKKMDEYFRISEERFRLLVENARDYAIFHLNQQGVVTSWNIGAERVFGYKEGDIIGKHFSLFFTPEDQKKGRPRVELLTAAKKGSATDDNWAMRSDGEHFWGSGVTTVMKDNNGKPMGFAKIVRDLTEQKRQEQRKDEFISMASHELKTPITSMKLFLDILHAQVKRYKDAKVETYIGRLKDQTDKLRELVADLLDVSRIETGKLSFHKEKLRLDLLIKDTVEALQPTSSTHAIVIEKADEAWIHADKFRIYQVVTNLLINAIKYSAKQDKILVRIEKEDRKVIVSVEDFGIGIAPEQQKKIFEKLYQVNDPHEKTYPGLGMGLYISKEIIKRHQGTIGVRSQKGKGSTFFFRLPLLE